MAHLAKDSPTCLRFTYQLGNPYHENPENNNGKITIWFVDAPNDASFEHDSQNVPEDKNPDKRATAGASDRLVIQAIMILTPLLLSGS